MQPPRARVLIIEGEADTSSVLLEELDRAGYTARSAPPGPEGLDALEQFQPQVAVVKLNETGEAGADFLKRARLQAEGIAFVGLTDGGSFESVMAALRSGADSAVVSPEHDEPILPIVERALEKADAANDAVRFRRRAEETLSMAQFDSIIGSHPSMQELLKKVAYVAGTRATVLINGESGTGKELIAAAIHQNSKRRGGPFVRLNSAALAESVLESEIFGHEKGAFTGAMARREGRFKQADGGTLFFDEISELPLSVQVKLLRFLQEREFERVGGNETLRVDVRIVAATNRDLRSLVSDGKFREDLYYRLAVVKLDVPPLRARPSDILVLATHLLRQYARENEVGVTGFTEAARRALVRYSWPGNVRELQNTIEQAVILAESELVDASELPLSEQSTASDNVRLMIPGVTMEELERYAVTETLKAVGGSATRAAEILGISRRTIQYRIKEWGLSERVKRVESDSSELGEDDATTD